MLQAIRDRATGLIAWIIIILLIIPFALWGINQYFSSSTDLSVAQVNGVPISTGELRRAYEQERQRLQAMLGPNFNSAGINEAQLRRNALQGLIQQQLLEQAVHEAGYRVSDAVLAAQIHAIGAFQSNGRFSPALYEQVLRSQGMAPATFEARFRRSLIVDQLAAGVIDTALVTDGELDDVIRLRDQTRDVAYMVLSADQFLPGTTVSDAEVERYYNAHRGRYMNPEQVSVDYIELSVASLAKEIHPTEQELRDLYQQEAARFTEPEQRRAEDILIRVAKDASPQQVAAARAKAEGLLQRIRAGASFEQLAKEYSQDPGSAAKGGDLGYIAKGMTDKSFQDALFSIPQVGQVVGPVHDSYGFHLIKLTGTQPGSRLSFQQARPALERQYRRQRAETLFYKESNAFTNLAYEHPDSLEPAAKALGLPIQHSGWFTRQGGGAGIAANPKVVAAAFSNAVLAQGNNSDPVQLAPDDAIVLRVREHKAATLRPLSEVSAEIRNELRMKTAQGGAEAAGQAVLQQLRKGVSVPALAAQYKATLQQANAVPRTDTKIDGAVLRTAFTLPRPAPGKPSFGGVALKSGYAVVVVSAVHDGNPATVSKQDRLQLRRALTRLYGANQFEDLLEVLRQNAKIVIHKDRL